MYIYYNRTEIAKHQRLSQNVINGIRTDEKHLPFSSQRNISVEELCDRARDIGPKTFEVVRRMFDEAKIKEQVSQNVQAILEIAEQFSTEILEKACDKSLKKYHIPYYKTIYAYAKSIYTSKELTDFKESNKNTGIVRGADYYRKGDLS